MTWYRVTNKNVFICPALFTTPECSLGNSFNGKSETKNTQGQKLSIFDKGAEAVVHGMNETIYSHSN